MTVGQFEEGFHPLLQWHGQNKARHGWLSSSSFHPVVSSFQNHGLILSRLDAELDHGLPKFLGNNDGTKTTIWMCPQTFRCDGHIEQAELFDPASLILEAQA